MGVNYKDRSIAHKILRIEESNLGRLLTKTPDQLLKDCVHELEEDKYDMTALRKEMIATRRVFYNSYLAKIDRSSSTDIAGTLVSKIIAENAKNVLILPIAFAGQDSKIKGFDEDLAFAIAAKQNASIVNHSFGAQDDGDLYILEYVIKHPDVLFVIPAGNKKGKNLNEVALSYLNAPNVIVVGAVNSDGTFADDYSCYGSNVVDVAALGEVDDFDNNIIHRGTSLAAPRVTALAARIKYINPKLSASQIKNIICSTASRSYEFREKLKYGVINKKRAIRKAKSIRGLTTNKRTKLPNYDYVRRI